MKCIKISPEDTAANCIKLLKAYIGNLVKDPQNEKFKKINLLNANFKEKVGNVAGGINFLKALGFEEKETTLEIAKVDLDLINKALKLLS